MHSGPTLLDKVSGLDPKVRALAAQRLKEAGIDLILGEKVNLPDDLKSYSPPAKRTLTTSSGRELTSDVQFILTGNTGYNTSFLSTLSPPALLPTGEIDCLPTLQIKGYPHMFAFGDACSQFKAKQAAEINFNLGTLVDNLKASISGGQLEDLPASKGTLIIVTTGTSGGFGQTPFGTLSGMVGRFLIRQVKASDLFLSKGWKAYTGGSVPA